MKINRVLIITAAIVVAIDQLTKAIFTPQGAEHYGSVLTTHNAFGVSADFSWPNIIVRISLIAIIIWQVRPRWAAGLMAGGILGNLIDTVRLGGVEDVIPVLTPAGISDTNFADLAWLVGLLAFLLSLYTTKGVTNGQDQDEAGQAFSDRGKPDRYGVRDLPEDVSVNKGAHDGQAQDQAGKALGDCREPAGDSIRDLPEDLSVTISPGSPVRWAPEAQQPTGENMRKLISRCRRCGFGRARDNGLCISCKAEEFNRSC